MRMVVWEDCGMRLKGYIEEEGGVKCGSEGDD